MRKAIISAALLILAASALSQSTTYDRGIRDTLTILISNPPSGGQNVSMTVEIWAFCDDTILAFSSGFAWNNANMYLDSASISPFVKNAGFGIFNYFADSFVLGNNVQKFQFGGYATQAGLAPYPNGRRKWASYYFTLESWNSRDTVMITRLPDSEVEFAFVVPGPFYPLSFQPRFEGPVLFPGIATDVKDDATIPSSFSLLQNFPNPFNPETTIKFELAQKSRVELDVFNILGQKVSSLVNLELSAGVHNYNWDGRFDSGKYAPSGVYFYRLSTSAFSDTKKMVLLR